MAKVDLHVHSKYFSRPSEWFLQRLGAAEALYQLPGIMPLLWAPVCCVSCWRLRCA
ncbi:MAG: hypothetical protein JXR59_08115 [Desulfuromonadaceae bacterium]|nr:hypothetical protein [Desulfuromonadaceae bacterium]